ncbi:DNAJ heat shock family protein [Wolffia australiana]
MGADYYEILRVDRDVNGDDLKKAYRKQAMKWHPDKNPTRKKEADAKFKQISEAYAVLADPQRRVVYDGCEEEGIKRRAPASSRADEMSEFFGSRRGRRSSNGLFGADIFAGFGSD